MVRAKLCSVFMIDLLHNKYLSVLEFLNQEHEHQPRADLTTYKGCCILGLSSAVELTWSHFHL